MARYSSVKCLELAFFWKEHLPSDVDALQAMIGALVAERDAERSEEAQAEIERLRSLVKTLQRSQFGRRSERLDQDQLDLGLEDLDGDVARAEAALPAVATENVQQEPAIKERLVCRIILSART